jgi:hypothetical protein
MGEFTALNQTQKSGIGCFAIYGAGSSPYPSKNSPQYRRLSMSNPNIEFKKQKKQKLFAVNETPKICGIINSSHGHIQIDLDSGEIINVEADVDAFAEWVENIECFDIGEYREFYRDYEGKDTSFDILDLGFFRKDGRYIPPSKGFRNEMKRDFAEDGF